MTGDETPRTLEEVLARYDLAAKDDDDACLLPLRLSRDADDPAWASASRVAAITLSAALAASRPELAAELKQLAVEHSPVKDHEMLRNQLVMFFTDATVKRFDELGPAVGSSDTPTIIHKALELLGVYAAETAKGNRFAVIGADGSARGVAFADPPAKP